MGQEKRDKKIEEREGEAAIIRYQEERQKEKERMKEIERLERLKRTERVAEIAGKEQEAAERMNELIIKLQYAKLEEKRNREEKEKAEARKQAIIDLQKGRKEQRRYKARLLKK